ncbi:uncharacterized mitochondrial protein atmg00310 [Phtheirospermum japonicum]|uniref:Uncharacterized mitochondrial protein atmg00310 n=1 Tax=Phtheirospermum japonicum TaxID=374723 RepID=A0A830C0R9_9LAMI|nr:uncharacterized mitochondrial protein atmg00310 [Phtheirospermum japonicum]
MVVLASETFAPSTSQCSVNKHGASLRILYPFWPEFSRENIIHTVLSLKLSQALDLLGLGVVSCIVVVCSYLVLVVKSTLAPPQKFGTIVGSLNRLISKSARLATYFLLRHSFPN